MSTRFRDHWRDYPFAVWIILKDLWPFLAMIAIVGLMIYEELHGWR